MWAEPTSAEMQNLFSQYDNTKRAVEKRAIADTLFSLLYESEYTEEREQVAADISIDTLNFRIWYWAAEWYYAELEDYEKVVEYCLRVTENEDRYLSDETLLSDYWNMLGLSYFRLGNFSASADAYYKTYLYDKQSGDKSRMSSSLNSLAGVHFVAKQPQEAEKYILEAIAINSLLDEPERMSVLLGTASEIYAAMGDYNKSEQYAGKALNIERRLGNKIKMGMRLSQLATAQIGLKKYYEARESLEEAVVLLSQTNRQHSLALCYNQLGDLDMLDGRRKEAADNYRRAAEILLEQGDLYNEQHSRKGLYDALKNDNPEEAMLHLERLNLLKDSVYRKQTAEAVSKYDAQYKTEQLKEQHRNKIKHYVVLSIVTIIVVVVLIMLIVIEQRKRYAKSLEVIHADMEHLSGQYEQLSEHYKNAMSPTEQSLTDRNANDNQFLQQVRDIVEDELQQGRVADVESVASRLNISVTQLRRRVNSLTDDTLQNFIINIRMQRARHLLETQRNLTAEEVAYMVGYDDKSSFSRAFKKYFGVPPSACR